MNPTDSTGPTEVAASIGRSPSSSNGEKGMASVESCGRCMAGGGFITMVGEVAAACPASGSDPGINKAHSEGWEGQIAWSPVAGLTLGGDATLTSAVIDSNNPFAAAFKGDHLPFTPKWNAGLNATYTRPIADGWVAGVIEPRTVGVSVSKAF